MKVNPVSFYSTLKNKTNFSGFADDNARQVVTRTLKGQKYCTGVQYVDYIENDTFTTIYTDADNNVVGKFNTDVIEKANNKEVNYICDEMKDVLEDLSKRCNAIYLARRISDINDEVDGSAEAMRKYEAEHPPEYKPEPREISDAESQENWWRFDAETHP